MKIQISKSLAALSAVLFLAFIFLVSSVGVNDGGYRTVIQYPTGHLTVKFSEGWYFAPFSKVTTYSNVITDELSDGVAVRYQDGGRGTVDGLVRVQLPNDDASMLKIHREFGSNAGLLSRLIEPETKQALMQTAGLMTSEEAYAERRSEIANWSEAIMERGRFVTRVITRQIAMSDGTMQNRQVPAILEKDGQPQHQGSPLTEYNLKVSGFQVTAIDFEPATQKQIDEKRQAEMAAITARANADRAAWEEKQVQAEGKKAVAARHYEQLQINEKSILEAEREKQVAVIAAERQKQVNAELLEAARIDVQTAKEQAQAITARAQAEAKAKQLIIEADGALQQKLDAYVKAQEVWAAAYAKRAVPQVVFGASESSTGSNADATQFQSMLNAMLAKELVVNPKVTK